MSWLDDLKVGDKVFECTRYVTTIEIVTKITPKTIVVGNKSDGSQRGGRCYELKQLNPELEEKFLIEQENFKKIRWVENNLHKIPKPKLVEFYDMLHPTSKGE